MDNTENKEKRTKKLSKNDIIGICSGLLTVVLAIVMTVSANVTRQAGVSDAQIPEDAVTLYGTAAGRNGDITVKVVATDDKIYQIKVTEHSETDGIGTLAVNGIPQSVFEQQSLSVDAVSSATITSDAVKAAIGNALASGGINPYNFGIIRYDNKAEIVETGVKVVVLTASEWADKYPDIYQSYMKNSENSEVTDYLADYPMLKVLYEDFGFAKYYSSARGHFYDVHDLTETGRPHAMANCFTCKTPNFTGMVNEMGDSAYSLAFNDVLKDVNEPISCYNCHANDPETLTITHSYLVSGLGSDFENVDASSLTCGQCHVEYYFDPDTKATMLPHSDIASMNPDAILDYFNNLMVDGMPFADFTNPRTGVRQIKVQHPEFETYMGDGSKHRGTFTCADCHMGEETAADGSTFKSHYLTSPLNNQSLIDSTCSACHADLVSEVKALQANVEKRTNAVGEKLVDLTEKLADAVAKGSLSGKQLDEVRSLARNAQFYWDFVFVENSEGAHNSALTYQCLDKAEKLADQALAMFK